MIRTPASVALILLTAIACLARQDGSLAELTAKADRASGGQQADLCLEVSGRALKLAIASYKQEKIEDAETSLDQVVTYADKAHRAAIHSGKRIKHTEIKIREMAGRLRDLKSDVSADSQPGVQAAIDKLESFRTQLLKSMFESKKKHD
ncbi:MAG: hypothetical protein J2P13_02625 [Acidobacteria bacterium]|nr:hypothetical protein [Acidobacteriota bacterium]